MCLVYIMALTRRKQRRSRQTMRAGAPTAAGAADAAKYINYNLAELNEALDKLSGVFGGKNKDYFEDYDLTAVKQKTSELFDELEALEQMIKNTKYYNPDEV